MNVFSVSSWQVFMCLGVLLGQGNCCNHGWLRFGNNCYKIFQNSALTSSISRLKCYTEGAELISLSSFDVWNFFSTHVEHLDIDHIWVGLRLFLNSSLVWDDGTPANDQRWVTAGTDMKHRAFLSRTYDPLSCYAYNKSNKTVTSDWCFYRYSYACVRNLTIDITNEQCSLLFGQHSFTGESTGHCIFKYPTPAMFSQRDEKCGVKSGTFIDLDELLRDGLTNFHEKQMLTNDGSKYWTAMTMHNGELYSWGNGEILDPELKENLPFHNGSGDCVTVQFNFSDTLEVHLHQTDCSEENYVLCSALSPLQTATLPPTTTAKMLLCPRGHNWKVLAQSDYCYWETSYETSKMSWDEARVFCSAFGGNLASFHNMDEERVGLSFQYGSLNHPYWIGLSLDPDTGDYRWSDGSPLDYQNWAPGHPDDKDKTLKCVAMDAKNKHWVSSLCGVRSWFVCKAPKQVNLTTPVLPTKIPLTACEGGTRSHHFDSHCYFVHNETYSWHRARQYCEDKGYSIASVHNTDELEFLLKLVYEEHNSGSLQLWIGLNSLTSDTFEWEDGTPVDFTFWNDGQPKDYKLKKCANMHYIDAVWQLENCNVRLSFICKRRHNTAHTVPVKPTKPVPLTGNCKKGWVPHHDTCYLVVGARHQERANWSEAVANCNARGGYLVSIRHYEDQTFLAYLLQDLKDDAWIGLVDVIVSGAYYWIDNSELIYTNWAPGEPSFKAMKENCVKMVYNDRKSGVWKDDNCSKKLPYICYMRKDPKLPDPGYQRGIGCLHPEGWLRLDTQCFKLFTAPLLSWVEAERNCRRHGAHLISVSDFSVQTVAAFLGAEIHSSIWTGLQYHKKNQKFWWLNGASMTTSMWAVDEPATAQLNSEELNCFESTFSGHWKTGNCSETLPYICQISTVKPSIVKRYAGNCPNTSNLWLSTDSSYCYIADPEDKTDAYTALSRCLMFGSNLISLHNLEEVPLLKKSLPAEIKSFYIGLMKTSEDSFRWTDSSPVDFVNWAPGQPENSTEECVEAFGDDLKWKVVPCAHAKNFVCASKKDHEINSPESSGLQSESPASVSTAALCGIIFFLTLAVLVVAAAVFYYKPLGKSRFRIFQKQSQSMSFENALYSVNTANLEFQKEDSGL
ncbi:macrophage mannose receptor 1-like [Uloborus diversus]|uniref:macrophage mannose receptor 1-like n=1 Tax=Uloborus diversus TaxID=327109 RepID=UPI0024092C3A|nr:macrophage mannose receptor 1-like [Uloborus diversus]